MNVTVKTRTVGQHFGTCGIIRSAKNGRKLAETPDTYPLGFTTAAIEAAKGIARRKGWTVIEPDR